MHLLVLIFIGTCFGLEKRQSEYDDFYKAKRNTRLATLLSTLKLISAGENPIKEHLIPPILTAETPEWRIAEEELPNTPEQRELRWLEDEARFGEFPLGTIRQIEKNAPTAVVVPASKDTPLQVARNGQHVFVTNDKVMDSPLKFISHHHPSLRTVDLSALADDLNLIFAAPHRHRIPEVLPFEQQDWGSSEEEQQERSAQFDVPEGLNASGNPFESTVLILPDDSPVKKYLKELQDKMKGNQTQGERSANQGVFIPYAHHQGVFVPLEPQFVEPAAPFVNHQPVDGQFSQQETTLVNHPFLRDSQQNNSEQVGAERNAQFDLPQGLNSSGNPFESTVLILPDDNPVKKQLKELQDKMKMKQQGGNQTQQQVNQTQERSSDMQGNPALVIPTRQEYLQPDTSFIKHLPDQTEFPHQETIFVDEPVVSNSEQGNLEDQARTAQFDLPEGLNASGNPFESTVLILPDDNPVKKQLKELQDKMKQEGNQTREEGNSQERTATFHGNRGLFIPTHQRFLQPTTSFINQQPIQTLPVAPGFSQFPQQQTTFINQPFFRDSEAKSAEPTHHHKHKHHHKKYDPKIYTYQQPPAYYHGYQRVASPAVIDVPRRRERWNRSIRSQTASSPGDFNILPFSIESFTPGSRKPLPFSSNTLAPHSQEAVDNSLNPFLKAASEPLTNENIESISSTIPEVFPQPGGYFPIIQGTSPNALPLQKPSDDPYYDDLKRISPINITALLSEYPDSNKPTQNDAAPEIFPLIAAPCTIPVITANTPNGAPLTKPSDDPFFPCINKTKARFSASLADIKECVGYTTIMCLLVNENLDESLKFFHLPEASPNARSAEIDFEEIVGPLNIFQFHNQDNSEEISVVELNRVFPGEMRAAEANPLHHHHHGSHFFLHQHGFIPNQECQGAVLTPTQQTGGQIPHLATKVNAGFGLVHQLTPTHSQSVQISGNGNGVSQSQAAVHANSGNLFNGGQNVYISGAGNSISQSQSAVTSNQNSEIHGSGNSVAVSANFQRKRRSLVELVNDPNVKLDVPKTITNIGTVAKTSFHDEKQPMYHLNNMGLIIPSHYRIVNAAELDDNNLEAKHEITRSINQDMLPNDGEVHNFNQEENDNPLTDTFNKFGSALRQSIQAGQQTLAHVGDIAHSARQVVHTAKSAAPQIFLPRHQKTPDKVMLITPKLLETKNPQEAGQDFLQAQNTRDFVKMGDLMDALSVSNPNEENLGVEKIVIERKGGQRKPTIVGRYKDVDETNLKDFVSKMKGEFDSLLKEKLKQDRQTRRLTNTIKKLERKTDKAPLTRLAKQPLKLDSVLGQVQNHADIIKSKSDQVIETLQDANGKFIDTLRTLSGSKATPKDNMVGVTHIILPKNFPTTPKPTARLKTGQDEPDDWDKQVSSFLADLFEEKTLEGGEEMVGAPQFSRNSLNLRPDLMKPFMGRASKASLRKFLKQHGNKIGDGDEVVGNSNVDEKEMEKIKQAQKVLGAVNPLMFEKLFNETMSGSDGKSLSPYDVFTAGRNTTEIVQVCQDPTKQRTSMKITRELLKPFMGRLKGKDGYIKVIPVENNEEGEEVYYMEK